MTASEYQTICWNNIQITAITAGFGYEIVYNDKEDRSLVFTEF